MSGQGFGSFMEGLQGGIKFGQEARSNSQKEKLYDSAIRQLHNGEKSDQIGRDQWNKDHPDDQIEGDNYALGDPLGVKMFDWAKKLMGGGNQQAAAVPVAARDPGLEQLAAKQNQVASDTNTIPQALDTPPQAYAGAGLAPYADGGTPAEEEKAREQARAERYGATARQAVPAVGNVAGNIVAAGPRATRGALNSLADVVDMGTDDPLNDHPVTGRVGQMIEGAFDAPRVAIAAGLRGVGDAVGGVPDKLIAGGNAPPAAAVPTGPSAPLGSAARTQAVSRSPGAPAAAVPTAPAGPTSAAPAAPTKEMTPEIISKIPWDKVNPIDMPKFSTEDWVGYRQTAMKQMMQRGGMTYADAFDKVDQQVIGMQQRGTKALLQQAILREQSGDLKGAANALVQMFQYIPTGTDAVVGEYKGQLVAQFIDEKTKKPVGDPTPVNHKMLSDLWVQYSDPKAWAQLAEDRAKLSNEVDRTGIMRDELKLRGRTLDEYQIPSMRSNTQYQATMGEAALAKAVGGGGEGAGGMKPSEAIASDKDVRETVAAFAMRGNADGDPLYAQLQDPNVQDQLIAAISKIRRQTGGNSEDILLQILKMASGKQ
jgi:hypothetical protein